MCVYAIGHMWRAEGNSFESILSFHHTGPYTGLQAWRQVPLITESIPKLAFKGEDNNNGMSYLN